MSFFFFLQILNFYSDKFFILKAIAFAFGWKLTLVILASTPAIVMSGFLQMKALAGFGAKVKNFHFSM